MRRSWLPLLAVALLLVAVSCLGTRSAGRGAANTTDMGKKPAPDFALLDQNGRPLSLADLRGRVAAITFLYTSCPDVCPTITNTFAEVHDRLGDDRGRVALLVVTVDPERDTVERVRQYLEAQGLAAKLRFLTGDRPTLEAVWAAYYVGVVKGPVKRDPDSGVETYSVDHQNLVHLLDAAGRQRTLVRGYDFTAEQLLGLIRPLLREAAS